MTTLETTVTCLGCGDETQAQFDNKTHVYVTDPCPNHACEYSPDTLDNELARLKDSIKQMDITYGDVISIGGWQLLVVP